MLWIKRLLALLLVLCVAGLTLVFAINALNGAGSLPIGNLAFFWFVF